MTVVVGLDLSLTATGIAWTDGLDEIETARYRSVGRKADDLAARRMRLRYSLVTNIIGDVWNWDPALVVVENPSYGSQHGSQHDRSGLWWLVVDSLFHVGIPVATVAPQGRAKYGTGKGNADKKTVLAATRLRFPQVDIADDNEADALLLAAMGARHLGQPIDGDLPQACLDAMAGAAWPEQVAA